MYPFRENYKCPDCKTGTMKWQGEYFASTYVLGRSFCDNPECVNNKERGYANLLKLIGCKKDKGESPEWMRSGRHG